MYETPISKQHTRNFTKYVKEYDRLAKAVTEVTGFKMTAFDPGLRFAKDGVTVTIPISFAKALMEYVEKQRKEDT